MSSFPRLRYAHGLLWLHDPWYRRAWFAGPFLAAVVGASSLLLPAVGLGSHGGTSPGSRWGKPAAPVDQGAQADALGVRARTDPTALAQLQTLANTGNAAMQFALGVLYDPNASVSPRPVTPDKERARQLYKQASLQGFVAAEANYGIYLLYGLGGPTRLSDGAQWLEKAAQQHNVVAERVLGIAYRDGLGVPKDLVLARTWLDQAAAAHDAYAVKQIALMNAPPTPANPAAAADALRARAQRDPSALTELENNANSGDPNMEFALAVLYDPHIAVNPRPVATDPKKAFELFRRAAVQGDLAAAANYGIFLFFGQSGPAQPREAIPWLRKAAAANQIAAIRVLGIALDEGKGVRRNKGEALRLFQRAADGGDGYAAYRVGDYYMNARPTYLRDIAKARLWLGKAAKGDDAFAAQSAAKELAELAGR